MQGIIKTHQKKHPAKEVKEANPVLINFLKIKSLIRVIED